MRKHILFCIHGMGEHDASWPDAGIRVLKSAFAEYENLGSLDFDDTFEVVPVVYDKIFVETRKRANQDFAAFKQAVLDGVDGDEAKSKDAVERQLDRYGDLVGAESNGFVWTHILDVILYRFSTTLRMGIDVSVAEQIMKALSERPHQSWSVLAHSLGSSVAHNTLVSLYNTGFTREDGTQIEPLNPLESRCNTLAMIANVSRVLQRDDAKVYETRVKPGSATAGRLCAYYLNIRHKLDPFTHVKPFDPDLWPDAATFSRDRYQMIRPSHIHFEAVELPRVHDFDHYLLNPRVHVPLFRSLLGKRIVSDSEYDAARAGFDAEIVSDSIDLARSKLEARLPATSGNWTNLLSAIKRLMA